MTGVVLHRDWWVTVAMGSARVRAADVPAVTGAADLLAEARRVREGAADAAEEARKNGFAAGHAAGLADGLRAGEAEMGARLFALETRAAEQRLDDRVRVGGLAVSALRRIAGGIADGPMVAALAQTAVTDLLPGTQAVVKVAPAMLPLCRERLADRADVVADPSLGATDIVIETPLGRTLAGLDVQLAAIARLLQPRAEPDDAA